MTNSGPPAPAGRLRSHGEVVVWGLAAVFAITSAALAYWVLQPMPVFATDATLPWWALIPIFALVQVAPLNFEFRSQHHSVHITQVPLVLGLYFVSPVGLLLSRFLGVGAVMLGLQRRGPARSAFNLGLDALVTALAVVVFRFALPLHGLPSAPTWGPLLSAAVTEELVSAVAATAAVAALSAHVAIVRTLRLMSFSLMIVAVNASFALLASTSYFYQPDSLWALGLFAALALFAFAGYKRKIDDHAALSRLYRFTHGLGPIAVDVDDLAPALTEARELLHADRLELRLSNHNQLMVVRLTGETVETDLQLHELDTPESTVSTVPPQLPRRSLIWRTASSADHMQVSVGPGNSPIGTLRVEQRSGGLRRFDRGDLALMEAVASQLGAALEKGRLVESLRWSATRDSLTGISNLDSARATVTGLLSDPEGGCVVMLLDLDHFQDVNDTLGHEAGDLLLQETARRLTVAAPDGATAARIGSDQFLLILPEPAGSETARLAALAIKSRVDGPLRLADLSADLRVTIGVARGPQHGQDSGLLLRRAELAMMAAKGTASGLAEWEPHHERGGPRRLALVTGLRHALTDGSLGVAFQPKLQLGTGRVVGMEALVRWNHPELGSVPPSEFVPLAEATGLVGALTTNVLRQALENCHRWRAGGTPVGVSVNLSTRSLSDPLLLGQVAALLTATQVEPHWLTLEITESSVMDNPSRSVEVLRQLRMLGVRLSIDDFGTGYSSLTYVKGLPVHELKVDKSFVDAIAVDETDRAVVRAIVELARSLQLTTVAEGVEDADQALALADIGLTEVQGYFYARPMSPEQAADWLRTRPVSTPSR